MEKYPNYYYSPLEARQRKADRKKKFIQKFSSKRYKQDSNDGNDTAKSIDQTDAINIGQIANFCNSNSTSFPDSPNVNTAITFEQQVKKNDFSMLGGQIKIVDRKVLDARMNQMNSQSIHNYNLTYTSPSTQTTSSNLQQQINQMNNSPNSLNGQNVIGNLQNNYQPMKLTSKCPLNQLTSQNQFSNLDDRKVNRSNYQLQPNVLYYSSNSLPNNNMMHHLLNNQQQSTYSNCRSLNIQEQFANDNQFNNSGYYHNSIINSFSTPTIYHVTNKDPNLNSTLNDNNHMNNMNNYSFFGNGNFNNLNFNPNLNANHLLSLNNQHEHNSQIQSQIYPTQLECFNTYNSAVGQMFSFDDNLVDAEKQNFYSPQQQQALVNKNQFNKLLVKWE